MAPRPGPGAQQGAHGGPTATQSIKQPAKQPGLACALLGRASDTRSVCMHCILFCAVRPAIGGQAAAHEAERFSLPAKTLHLSGLPAMAAAGSMPALYSCTSTKLCLLPCRRCRWHWRLSEWCWAPSVACGASSRAIAPRSRQNRAGSSRKKAFKYQAQRLEEPMRRPVWLVAAVRPAFVRVSCLLCCAG